MNDRDRAAVAAAVGAALLYLALSGDYKDYVRPGMGPLLLAASILLVAFGALGLAGRGEGWGGGSRAGGGRAGSAMTVLALAPVLVTIAVAPAPLGSYAASLGSRTGGIQARSQFPPLPPAALGAVPLTVMDFISRAEYDPGGSLRGLRVRLVGRVTPQPGAPSNQFWLVRFAIYCCAADAIPLRVRVTGPFTTPPTDTWVEVTGRWRPAPVRPPGVFDPNVVVILDADTVRVVAQPADPYDGTL